MDKSVAIWAGNDWSFTVIIQELMSHLERKMLTKFCLQVVPSLK